MDISINLNNLLTRENELLYLNHIVLECNLNTPKYNSSL